MSRGEAERREYNGSPASELAADIGGLKPFEAIILGDLAEGLPPKIEIDLAKRTGTAKAKEKGTYSRTRGTFIYRPGRPAFVLADYDTKGMPPEVRDRLHLLGGFRAALSLILPGLLTHAHVARASTSAGLFNEETGERYPGSGGEHLYLLIRDGSDTERFLKTLHERAWAADFGWYMIGGAGQLLERSIIDRMVWAPERLCFEGGPILQPPLAQDAGARQPVAVDGPPLDSVASCPSLSSAEEAKVRALKRASRLELAPEADRQKAAYVEEAAAAIASERGVHPATARRMVEARFRGELFGSDTLVFDDPGMGTITVAEVMAEPQRFDDLTLADPLEGPSYGRGKAKVFVHGSNEAVIHSFAHGGGIYKLKLDARAVEERVREAGRHAVDVLVTNILTAALTEDEVEALVRLASEISGSGIRAINARLKAERRKRARKRRRRRARQRWPTSRRVAGWCATGRVTMTS